MDEHSSKDMIPPYEAITRVQEQLYPEVGRATAELTEALSNRYVIAAGIPLVQWFDEGLFPPPRTQSFRHERIGDFWSEIPVVPRQRDAHFQWGTGEFRYARWGEGEFGYLVRDKSDPVWTFTQEFEHVVINELTLLSFIRERKAVIGIRGPATSEEIRGFIRSHDGRDVNNAEKAFRELFGPRANGLARAAWRSYWKEVRENPQRGRPRNLQRTT